MNAKNQQGWSYWSKYAIILLPAILACVVVPPLIFPLESYPEHIPVWDWFLLIAGIDSLLLGMIIAFKSYEKNTKIRNQQLKSFFLLGSAVVLCSFIGMSCVWNTVQLNQSQIFLVNGDVVYGSSVHQWRNYTFHSLSGNGLIFEIFGQASAPSGKNATLDLTCHGYASGMVKFTRNVNRTDRFAGVYWYIEEKSSKTEVNVSIEIDLPHIATNIDEKATVSVYDATRYTRIYLNLPAFNLHYLWTAGAWIFSIASGGCVCIKESLSLKGKEQRARHGLELALDRKEAILSDIQRWNEKHLTK